ncbi:MAG: flagellar biosynthetic protein FliQ [Phycisphaerales bacterium]|nr:flagellar biosynthetic protein FliQ [Phycisphaerales bacterium]
MHYDETTLDAVRHALIVTLQVALPILGAAVVVGLLISILQSVTQIQDQTVGFVPKLIVMMGAIIVLTPWIVARLVDFASTCFSLS